jgi:hypothetical protein
LPKGHVFDGELVALDDAGQRLFIALMFGRRRPTYVGFDLLMADGIDLRPLPLSQRRRRWHCLQGHFELRVVPFPHRPVDQRILPSSYVMTRKGAISPSQGGSRPAAGSMGACPTDERQ